MSIDSFCISKEPTPVKFESLLTYHLDRFFGDFLRDPNVSEISVNRPNEIFVGEKGKHGMTRYERPLSYEDLLTMAETAGKRTSQKITPENPILSAQIPSFDNPDLFYRVQFVRDPAVYAGNIGFSLRKPSVLDFTFDNYKPMFQDLKFGTLEEKQDQELLKLYDSGDFWEFLKLCVLYRKNIGISGGTNSGKTTLLNSMLKLIPKHERLITIEDAREIVSPLLNTLQLYYSRGGQGVGKHTPQDLLEACLRLRPDRLMMGELRGAEAFAFLNLIASGHPGSLFTLHSESPIGAINRLALMVLQSGTSMSEESVKIFVRNNVDVIVQIGRGDDGSHICSEIYFKVAAERNKQNGFIH